MITPLTGMEVANARLYDGSTACDRSGFDGIPRDEAEHRRYVGRPASTLCRHTRTLCEAAGIKVIQLGPAVDGELELSKHVDDTVACVIGQNTQRLRHADRPHAALATLPTPRARCSSPCSPKSSRSAS